MPKIYSLTELPKMVLYHRKKAGLSRNDLALIASVGKTAIYDIEHGKNTIQLDTLLKILVVLNIVIEFKSPLTFVENDNA
jgi:HTH-type transcriptional regulator/antitoxin HipB